MSAQLTFEDKQAIFDEVLPVKNGKYITKEPKYGDSIPKNILRRMGKVCRMGSRTALQTIEETNYKFDSVIVGSGYGDMSQCYRFLDQVIAYDEGSLTPTNFVNASPNILAGTIALGETIRGYNSTHFQKGTAFYSALFDAVIQTEFGTSEKILVGGSDEISDYYYRIQELIKPFRKEATSINEFYLTKDAGFIPGEASVFVGLSNEKTTQSICEIKHMETKFDLDSKSDWLYAFLTKANIELNQIETIITGENDCIDDRQHYVDFESNFTNINHYRFKHFFGESANAIGVATWLACFDMEHGKVPDHFIKSKTTDSSKYYLLYNHYSGNYHQLILLEKV